VLGKPYPTFTPTPQCWLYGPGSGSYAPTPSSFSSLPLSVFVDATPDPADLRKESTPRAGSGATDDCQHDNESSDCLSIFIGRNPSGRLCLAQRRSEAGPPTNCLSARGIQVPEVTVAFWITKALTTGMGEPSSDYLVHRLPPVVAVAAGGIALVALALQLTARRYIPWTYWLAVAMVGVFGTMASATGCRRVTGPTTQELMDRFAPLRSSSSS
jgi:hypothetical protein